MTLLAVTGRVASLGGHLQPEADAAALAGLVVLSAGLLTRWPSMIPWAVLLTAGGYLIAREGRSVVDGWAAAVGVLLLVAAELATWSIEHDARIRAEPALVVRRVLALGGLALAALLVNLVLLATAGLSAPASVLVAAAGVAAAVTAVAVVLRLGRA